MNLNHLIQITIFVWTAESGSFRKATEDFQLLPFVVSHYIYDLEQQLKVAFVRFQTNQLLPKYFVKIASPFGVLIRVFSNIDELL